MINKENYIEIDEVNLILEIATRKGQISRSAAITIITEIQESAKNRVNKEMDASKYKTFEWKYGNR